MSIYIYNNLNQLFNSVEEWRGAYLHDKDLGGAAPVTKIKEFKYNKNEGEEWFEVVGEEYSCGGKIDYMSLLEFSDKKVVFNVYGHVWEIYKDISNSIDKNNKN